MQERIELGDKVKINFDANPNMFMFRSEEEYINKEFTVVKTDKESVYIKEMQGAYLPSNFKIVQKNTNGGNKNGKNIR